MRSVILIAAMIIGEAINPDAKPSEKAVAVMGTVLLVAILMDICEFFGNIL